MRTRYGAVALLLVGITAVSLGLTALCGVRINESGTDAKSVVATTYPMYTATLQVAKGSTGVTVTCLTKTTAGCLHDYQMTPQERVVLDHADLLIMNGAGAEGFLEPVLPQLSATVLNTAAWALPDEETSEHGEHEHQHNEHIWLDPTLYAAQVKAIQQALCEADRANEDLYCRNAEKYLAEIGKVNEELAACAALLPPYAVLFHDSMAYIANALGLHVLATLPIGEEEEVTSAEVAEAVEAVRGKDVLLLYDEQYPQQLTRVAQYAASGKTVLLSSAVSAQSGVTHEDVWLWSMRENIRRLKESAT